MYATAPSAVHYVHPAFANTYAVSPQQQQQQQQQQQPFPLQSAGALYSLVQAPEAVMATRSPTAGAESTFTAQRTSDALTNSGTGSAATPTGISPDYSLYDHPPKQPQQPFVSDDELLAQVQPIIQPSLIVDPSLDAAPPPPTAPSVRSWGRGPLVLGKIGEHITHAYPLGIVILTLSVLTCAMSGAMLHAINGGGGGAAAFH